MTEPTYPCAKCGVLRTKAQGGTVFTVCDACWDKRHGFDAKLAEVENAVMDERNAEIERLRAEVKRMKPIYDAAMKWHAEHRAQWGSAWLSGVITNAMLEGDE